MSIRLADGIDDNPTAAGIATRSIVFEPLRILEVPILTFLKPVGRQARATA